MQVVGVRSHTRMLRIGVSFEINGRPTARIATMAAVTGERRSIDMAIDV
jgi:hypothetical protein